MSKVPDSAWGMLLAVAVKKDSADGTSRVQVVRPDWSPELYELLVKFERLTALPS